MADRETDPRTLQRTIYILLGVIVALFVFIAYGHAERQRTEERTLAPIRAAVEEAQEQAEKLTSEIERFDSEDWKDVVPDVRSAASDLKSTLEGIDPKAIYTPPDRD